MSNVRVDIPRLLPEAAESIRQHLEGRGLTNPKVKVTGQDVDVTADDEEAVVLEALSPYLVEVVEGYIPPTETLPTEPAPVTPAREEALAAAESKVEAGDLPGALTDLINILRNT